MNYDLAESIAEEAAFNQIEHDQAALSDDLFNLAMQMVDMGIPAAETDAFIKLQCSRNELAFPPQQITARFAP